MGCLTTMPHLLAHSAVKQFTTTSLAQESYGTIGAEMGGTLVLR